MKFLLRLADSLQPPAAWCCGPQGSVQLAVCVPRPCPCCPPCLSTLVSLCPPVRLICCRAVPSGLLSGYHLLLARLQRPGHSGLQGSQRCGGCPPPGEAPTAKPLSLPQSCRDDSWPTDILLHVWATPDIWDPRKRPRPDLRRRLSLFHSRVTSTGLASGLAEHTPSLRFSHLPAGRC